MFTFLRKYKNLREILMDQKLASLGDPFVNFIYSLSISRRKGEPIGTKVDSHVLSKALKKAGLRRLLPSRTDRHTQADAAEALIVYVWAQNIITIGEGVDILEQHEDPIEAFCALLTTIKKISTTNFSL
ncbi:MAG: hypothetical protein OEX77_01060 [Candidatus Bathyarchaeota archaeon]|nr:hypothetical protein [Candidatus Bathyarchaeota archaeon]MDH5732716.1 hypothetical protein [Candidatus Bathyarchaeota archaeon]